MTTISLRLNDADSMLIKKYAEMNGISISDLVRQSVIEHIEDEMDLKAYEKAIAEFYENPVTYTHDEVKKMLELDWWNTMLNILPELLKI